MDWIEGCFFLWDKEEGVGCVGIEYTMYIGTRHSPSHADDDAGDDVMLIRSIKGTCRPG